ncbi:hypothetical protein BD310DRAFT_959103 [Dichomitus squalens]|uniref:Uncharacterized protein n=1 Tax=Dichomitus squalens TaxID=114155 RepID=A0A4Q9PUJ8_9APHY|nr:hypothetical protein BD310DRAFT_959103 [Dichomitus squalens]
MGVYPVYVNGLDWEAVVHGTVIFNRRSSSSDSSGIFSSSSYSGVFIMTKGTSPVPFDILRQVFDEISLLADLAAAALVCRRWTEPAQMALYQRPLSFVLAKPLSEIPTTTSLFAHTMETCPHLRPLLRDISLILSSYYTKERTGWLQLIPENTICKFKYTASVPDSSLIHNLAIFDTPSLLTVTEFTIGSLFSMDEISIVLSLPCLTRLTLEYNTSFDGHVDPALASASSVKHLILTSQINCWCPGAFRVFIALAPRLESFSTNGPFHDQRYASWRDWMEAEIASHGRTLRTLIIDARKMETRPSTPFLDDLVEDNASLVRLRIFPGAYTALLFGRLPPTLEVLEVDLASRGADDLQPGEPAYEALLECIGRVREARARAALREVVFRMFPGGAYPTFAEVAKACAASGVKFRCERPSLQA